MQSKWGKIPLNRMKVTLRNPKQERFQFWCTLIAVVCLDIHFPIVFFYHHTNMNPIHECQVFVNGQ